MLSLKIWIKNECLGDDNQRYSVVFVNDYNIIIIYKRNKKVCYIIIIITGFVVAWFVNFEEFKENNVLFCLCCCKVTQFQRDLQKTQ